jgi:hypothetical protein
MPSNAILHEAQQLHRVSDRLDSLAEEHPVVSDALVTISGSVRNTATLLEVLVAKKMGSSIGLDPAEARFAGCCRCAGLGSPAPQLVVQNYVEQRAVDL